MAKFQDYRSRYLCAGIVIIILLGATEGQNAGYYCNNEEDGFEAMTFSEGGTNVTVNKQSRFEAEESAAIGNDIMEKVKKDITSENIVRQLSDNDEMNKMREATDQQLQQSSKLIRPYYYPTCPEVTIWLRPGTYYWRYVTINSDGTRTYKYCYNYFSISIIECACNYCRFNYNPSSVYDRRYRCLPEYRYELVPVRCYYVTVKSTGEIVGKPGWGKIEYKRIRLPKDCCCHYYSYSFRNRGDQCAPV